MDRCQEDSLVGVRINEVVEKNTKDMAALREEIKVLKSQHEEDIQLMDGKINKLVKKHAKELAEVRSEMRSLKSEPAQQVQVSKIGSKRRLKKVNLCNLNLYFMSLLTHISSQRLSYSQRVDLY